MTKNSTNLLLDAMNLTEVEFGPISTVETTVMKLVPQATGPVETTPTDAAAQYVATGKTKKDLACEVYMEKLGAQRKVVIAAMMERAGLSKAGAGTYYQNFRSGKWATS